MPSRFWGSEYWVDRLSGRSSRKISTARNATRIFAHPIFSKTVRISRKETILTRFTQNCPKITRSFWGLPQEVDCGSWRKRGSPAKSLGLGDRYTFVSSIPERFILSTFDINPAKAPTKYVLESFRPYSLLPRFRWQLAVVVRLSIFWTSAPLTNIKSIHIHAGNSFSCAILSWGYQIHYHRTFQHKLYSGDPCLRYEYFVPRLQWLNTYLDNQQTQTLRQILCDGISFGVADYHFGALCWL